MFEESASEILSSIWESIRSWFTPTVLFILLNLMIATIAFTSVIANQKRQHSKHKTQSNSQNQPSVLQRIKSINFYSQYRSQEPQNLSLRHKQNPDSDSIFGMETHSNYIFQDMSQEHLQTHTQIQNDYHEQNFDGTQSPLVQEEKDADSDDFQGPTEENAEHNGHGINEVYSQYQTESHFGRSKSETIPASGYIQSKLSAKMRKWASLKSEFGHSEDEDAVEARRPATMREKRSAKATDSDEEVDAKADDFIYKFKQQLKLQRMDSIIRYDKEAI